VPQVRPNRVGPAIDQLLSEVEPVKRLIPELPLSVRVENPPADAGQRRGEDLSAHEVGSEPGDRLGDAAADVVPAKHRPVQIEVLDQPDDAAGLPADAVLFGRVDVVLVGLAKPAQIRNDHIGATRQRPDDLGVVRAVAGPSVQEHHCRTGADPVIDEIESVPAHPRRPRRARM